MSEEFQLLFEQTIKEAKMMFERNDHAYDIVWFISKRLDVTFEFASRIYDIKVCVTEHKH